MTDARAEARLRIAAAIHRGHCGCADAGPEHEDGDPSYLEQADAVLDLFEHVGWDRTAVPGPGDPQPWIIRRRLRLTGPVEPDPDHPDPPGVMEVDGYLTLAGGEPVAPEESAG